MLSDKQILDRQEKIELLEVAKKLSGDHAIDSCCAYGSKIAGYARSDSDYDMLLVLKSYNHIIRYAYAKNNVAVSVLIVDSRSLVNDAERATLGEFVAGRLLHVYEPLTNPEYLEKVETSYKKRVIMEEARELAAANPLCSELLIPVEYFLYSKVQKRSKVYPHALYSYVKTYSGSNAERNLEVSRKGFVRALREHEEGGYVRIEKDQVRILPEKLVMRKAEKTSLEISKAMRGTLSYLVHTYAGRRTLNFVKQEAVSKINRHRKIREIPSELKNPSSLLRLNEGILIDGKDWLKTLATNLGFTDYTTTRRKLGDLHAATTLYTMHEDARSERIVVKHFASVKGLKWAALNLWMAGVKKFDIDPSSRLSREYRALRYVKTIGIDSPEIVAVAIDNRLLITRYVEGEMLSSIIGSVLDRRSNDASAITLFGEALHRIHASGYTIVDTKPSNVLVGKGKMYFTDLEQFSFGDDKSWDVICFIYYSIKFTANEAGARRVVRAFLEGYLHDGNVSVIRRALSKKYIPSFYPALVLGVVRAVREEMKSCLKGHVET